MGKLFICPTPLGNLEDITLRAIRVLSEVDLIAAEDTRHTRKLLARYNIETSITSYHQHSSLGQQQRIIREILEGKTVALVSDAGTPGISDPGQQLILACVASGIEVDPLPGPCAAVTALSGSGFPMASFTYQGFLPRKGLSQAVADLASIEHPVVMYESPRRVAKLLEALALHMPDREVLLARELTKVHQQLLRGKPGELLETVITDNLQRGEFTIVLAPWHQEVAKPGVEELQAMVEANLAKGMSPRDAVAMVSASTGTNKREIYKMANKKKDT